MSRAGSGRRRRVASTWAAGVAAALVLGMVVVAQGTTGAAAAVPPGLTSTPVTVTPLSAAGAQCMDLTGTATTAVAGSLVQQYACQPRYQYNQRFEFVPQGSTGEYSIVIQSSKGDLNAAGVAATPMCVALADSSGTNGTHLVAATCAFSDTQTDQLWNVQAAGSAWTISSAASGRCIDVPMGSTSSGVVLQLWDCSGVVQQSFAITAQAYPSVGIVYQAWFDNGPTKLGCQGDGWADGPFGTPKGSAQVQSLSFGQPTCYSSDDPAAAQTHAQLLSAMGVSFVLIDDTNKGKTTAPASNAVYQASKDVTTGMSSATTPVKVAYLLSLTCWQVLCYPQFSSSEPSWDQKEMATWNTADAQAEIEDIAARYAATPSAFEVVNGKPLLVFYINQGNDVYCPHVPPASLQQAGLCPNAQYDTLTNAFNGFAHVLPATGEFDPVITVGGQQRHLSDVFTVRYGVVAANQTDYSSYDSRIWPMYCSAGCVGSESGYSAVSWAGSRRTWAQGADSVNASLAAGNGGEQYMVISAWNEFSSTDEYSDHAYTLEPNTYLQNVAGDEANGDPWYFFNKYKSTFDKWR